MSPQKSGKLQKRSTEKKIEKTETTDLTTRQTGGNIPWWHYASVIFVIVIVLFALGIITGQYILTPSPTTSASHTQSITPSTTITLSSTTTNTSVPIDSKTPTPTEIPLTPTIIATRGLIDVTVLRTRVVCDGQTTQPYAVVELLPTGGIYPYEYETQVNPIIKNPTKILQERETIILTIEKEKSVTLRIRSNASINTKWDWEGVIEVSLEGISCLQYTKTNRPENVQTASSFATNNILTITATLTNVNFSSVTVNPLPTATTAKTVTIIPPTINPSATAIPPSVTQTLRPTSTPVPTTRVPPSAKQCEDGEDNDGDTLIDFPADPECESLKDNQEKH